MSATPRSPAPGWYPAPDGRPASRWWDGGQWTSWLTDGRQTWSDIPASRQLTTDDLPALRFVEEAFLPEAVARGVIGPQQRAGLAGLVQAMSVEAATTSATALATAAASAPATAPPPAHATAPSGTSADAPTASVGLADELFASPRSAPVPSAASPSSPFPQPGTSSVGPPAPIASPSSPRPVQFIPGSPRTELPRQPFAQQQQPRPPSRLAQWWSRTWERIGSDVAVHGLAYLGVLLLFVGVFGLVAFAFGSVAPAMRPVAELASAAVTFGAARLLLRHGATVVARAMEGVGGLILPLMLVTSTVDGFGFPPDLHGVAMPVVLAAACVALAGGYVAWIARHRASGLRFVVAPTVWLGVAMGAIGLGRPIPTGQDIAVPGSGQVAALAVAVALTALAVRLVARSRIDVAAVLVPATRSAALVGSVIVAVLALVTWIAEGWPTGAVVVTSVAIAVTWQLLPRVPAGVADVGAVLWWALVAIRLVAEAEDRGGVWTVGLAGTIAALGFVVLLEVLGRRARSAVALGVAAGGLVLAVLVVAPSMPWVAGLTAVLTVWAGARRRVPYAVAGASGVLDALAAALPVIGVVAVAGIEGAEVGLLSAAGVVLLATIPARLVRLGRGDADAFWRLWWWSAGGVTAAVTVLAGLLAVTDQRLEGLSALGGDASDRPWSVVIAAVVLTAAAGFGPLPAVARVWTVVGLGWWAWLTGAALADAEPLLRVSVPTVVGLALVVVAHRVRQVGLDTAELPSVPVFPSNQPADAPEVDALPAASAGAPALPPSVPAALGFAGHALGLITLVLAGGGWAAEVALVAAALGWAVPAVAGDRHRSDVAARLDRIGPIGHLAPWTLALLAAPLAAMGALHLAEVVDLGDPWGSVALMVTGLLYAALVRTVPAVRRSAAVGPLTWIAFLAPVVAALIPGGAWPFVVAGVVLVGAVVLLPAGHRRAVMTWTAWAVVVPVAVVLVWRLAPAADPDRRDLLVLWSAVLSSGLLVLGALMADGARFGDPRALPRRRVLLPPAVLGVAQLLAWLAIAIVAPTPGQADVVLGAAALLLVIALVSGVGITAGIALVIGWLGWHLAADPADPWAEVAVAVGLVALGVGTSVLPGRRRGWSRWDVPVALAGAPAALFALDRAEGTQVAPVFTVVGLLVVGAAVRLGRHHSRLLLSEALGVLGTGIILVGTGSASPGWLALALLALSGAHTALAVVREAGVARLIRQVVGALAAVAAWSASAVWLGWSGQQTSDLTAVAGASVVVLLLAATTTGLLGRPWSAVWGGAATLMSTVALLVVVAAGGGYSELTWSWWHVAALLLLALAAGLVVREWEWGRGRSMVVGLGLIALLVAFVVLGWSPSVRAAVLVGLSAVFAVAMVLLARGRAGTGPTDLGPAGAEQPGAGWLVPMTGGGVAAVALALFSVSDAGTVLLAAPLAGATVQLAAAGYAWRRVGLRLAAPVLAWVTWAALVPEIAAGASASWYTVPVGLALLVVVGLWRAERRARGLPAADQAGVALELTGIAFLVVTSWVQTFTVNVLQALLAAGIGVLVLIWGLTTRVRRRVGAAAVVVLVSLVLAVAVPLVALIPAWGGAAVWIGVAVLGLIAVLAATLLEKGRAAVRSASKRAGDQGWE